MKKSQLKTMIRQIVREEVAMAINEVITELKQPTQQVSQPKPKKKVIEKKEFTKNSILNDVLNETAESDEWKTMGGGTYDSGRANEVLSSQYGDMMNSKPNGDQMVASMGVNPSQVSDTVKDNLVKDYSGLLKNMEKTAKSKRPV
tara:strand:+ start:1506 stop:1940 length:435 start_codon:yes stop_codon:yes gene_type:complete